MENFRSVDVKSLSENSFRLLDNDWMLITAGTRESFNTMTASWGGFGVLWDRPVAYIFIRPQRYTLLFMDKHPTFSLCFFHEKYRKILNYCGNHSGRQVDKIKNTGLIPVQTRKGTVVFEQARFFMECNKLYHGNILKENFIEKSLIRDIYPSGDFHHLFIGEIVECMQRIS